MILPDSSVATVDAQNIYGKYRLLQKTANFFGNQFTWIIVFACLIVAAIVIRIWRSCLKKNRDFVIIRTALKKNNSNKLNVSANKLNESQSDIDH